jgi:hypothetical protein
MLMQNGRRLYKRMIAGATHNVAIMLFKLRVTGNLIVATDTLHTFLSFNYQHTTVDLDLLFTDKKMAN